MSAYFIETSCIIAYVNGNQKVIAKVDSLEGELTSSFICLAELYEGIYRVKESEQAEKVILDFFKGLSEIYGVDEEIAKNFGEIRAELKNKGKIIEDFDILLAATCIVNNLTLVTGNPKHFKRIPNLKVLAINP
ncbi:type II toxin-antitoxin system VapC family toxin [Patescibacteria group bacterium]|nr:type II toxin-antitoxin system VapC family toxin [Patescibacteria group bacterium]